MSRLLAPHNSLRGVKLSSNHSFVEAIGKQGFNHENADAIESIKDALEFRAKFISHPGTHATYTWMTFSQEGSTGIMYFIPKGAGDPTKGEDPKTFMGRFILPVANDGYYEAPTPEPVLEALGRFTLWTLRWLIECAPAHQPSRSNQGDSFRTP